MRKKKARSRLQQAWHFGRSPSCLDQHGTGMANALACGCDHAGNPETRLPHPQTDIADQLLRTGEATHIADCRRETGPRHYHRTCPRWDRLPLSYFLGIVYALLSNGPQRSQDRELAEPNLTRSE
jgi:hypothetical protein